MLPNPCQFADVFMEVISGCSTSGQLFCNPANPPFYGTCTTDSNAVPQVSLHSYPNLVQCFQPQCADYFLEFTMLNRETLCTPADSCHYKCAEGNYFGVTVVGRTLETQLTAAITDTPVCGSDLIILSATANWGVPPYQFRWLHNGSTASSITVNPVMECREAYTVEISDLCENIIIESINLSGQLASHAHSFGDTLICSNANLLLHAASQTGATYLWEPSSAVSDPNIPNPQFTANQTTSLSLHVTDQNGCVDIECLTVTVDNLTTPSKGKKKNPQEQDLKKIKVGNH